MNNNDIPVWEKYTLTIEEADVYKRQTHVHVAVARNISSAVDV